MDDFEPKSEAPDRAPRWSVARGSEAEGYPWEILENGQVVGRMKSRADADTVCGGRTGVLREAGNRAADLRRNEVMQRQMKQDIRELLETLDRVRNVLKQRRPRDIIRAREDIQKLVRAMRGRSYSK